MSGILKPPVISLQPELQLGVDYIINGFKFYDVDSANGDKCPLFDGIGDNYTATAKNTGYWQTTGHYLDITFLKPCNIWYKADKNYVLNYTSSLFIFSYNDNNWVDISKEITQVFPKDTSATSEFIKFNYWFKYIYNIQPGRYKFAYPNSSLCSEWYLESITDIYTIWLKNDEAWGWRSVIDNGR